MNFVTVLVDPFLVLLVHEVRKVGWKAEFQSFVDRSGIDTLDVTIAFKFAETLHSTANSALPYGWTPRTLVPLSALINLSESLKQLKA